jgi:addiction module RelE/StbE family toxin
VIKIRYTKTFVKKFQSLPQKIKLAYSELEPLFKKNPFHPRLHSKGLHGKLRNFYSFRITRDYRVVYEFLSDDEAALITVRHRKDIYK